MFAFAEKAATASIFVFSSPDFIKVSKLSGRNVVMYRMSGEEVQSFCISIPWSKLRKEIRGATKMKPIINKKILQYECC